MTPCSALSGTRRFGGTYRLHLQGRRIVQQQEYVSYPLSRSNDRRYGVDFCQHYEKWRISHMLDIAVKIDVFVTLVYTKIYFRYLSNL
jgi:hypothetical protein